MKFTIKASDIKEGFNRIHTKSRNTKKVSYGDYSVIATGEDKITITAFLDFMKTVIEIELPAVVSEQGVALVIGNRLSETLELFNSPDTIEFEKVNAKVSSNNFFRVCVEHSDVMSALLPIEEVYANVLKSFNLIERDGYEFVGMIDFDDLPTSGKFVETSVLNWGKFDTFNTMNYVRIAFNEHTTEFTARNRESLSCSTVNNYFMDNEFGKSVMVWKDVFAKLPSMIKSQNTFRFYKSGEFTLIEFDNITIKSFTPYMFPDNKEFDIGEYPCKCILNRDNFIKYMKKVKTPLTFIKLEPNIEGKAFRISERPAFTLRDNNDIDNILYWGNIESGTITHSKFLMDTKLLKKILNSFVMRGITSLDVFFSGDGKVIKISDPSGLNYHVIKPFGDIGKQSLTLTLIFVILSSSTGHWVQQQTKG